MEVELQATLDVQQVDCFAEMAWLEQRKALQVLCQHAQRNGDVLSKDLVMKVAPALDEAGAAGVLASMQQLGLCDKQGHLLDDGRRAAMDGSVPIPEQGVYRLWVTSHLLPGNCILEAERVSPKAIPGKQETSQLPLIDRNVVFESSVSKNSFMLRKPCPSGSGYVQAPTRCTLHWDIREDGSDFGFSGNISGLSNDNNNAGKGQKGPATISLPLQKYVRKKVDVKAAGFIADLARTSAAFKKLGTWDAAKGRLAVRHHELKPDERRNFQVERALVNIAHDEFGDFDRATFRKLPVGPADASDAAAWARANLLDRLVESPAYRTSGDVKSLFAEVASEGPLADFAPGIPERNELLQALRKLDAEHFWMIAAPADLALQPAGPAVPARKKRAGAGGDTPAALIIPRLPTEQLSMADFLATMLQGVVPRKLLLSERFVRGDGNLEMLEALVQAIKASFKSATLEVWTDDGEWAGDNGTMVRRIREITGAAPKLYREVFSTRRRETPHDRFLLVLPEGGEGFGWQLSNSPLHARPATAEEAPGAKTPLKWNPMVALRQSAEVLAFKPLGEWLTNGGSK